MLRKRLSRMDCIVLMPALFLLLSGGSHNRPPTLLFCLAQHTDTETSSSSSDQQHDVSPGNLRRMAEDAVHVHGDYAAAVQYLRQAARLEPAAALNYYKLYAIFYRQRRLPNALEEIRVAADLDGQYRSTKAKLLVALGQCDQAVHEYALTEQWFIKTNSDDTSKNNKNKLDESFVADWRNAAKCQQVMQGADAAFVQQDWQTAASLFQQALQFVDGGSTDDLVWPKAQSLYHLGDYYGAISDTGKLLRTNGQHLEAFRLRGQAYHRLGEHEQAIAHYREALKLDPEHKLCKDGHKKLKATEKKRKKGDAAFEQANYAQAVEYWSQAAAVDDAHVVFIRTLQLPIAKAFSKMGNFAKARETAQAHLDQDETLEGLWTLGEILQSVEKHDEAVRFFQRAVEVAKDAEVKEAKQKLHTAQVALKQSKEKNYYKILGVARNASKKEIKRAYRELALKWHPDKNSENQEQAEKMFHDINEAHEVLTDDEMRGRYDRGENVFENQGGGNSQQDFFRQQFHQGSQGGQRFHFNF
jgi:DnaJ homolog subfamily C member 3